MFEINIIESSLFVSALICLLAGLLSFLSPCVLPIVPPYLAFMAGSTISDLKTLKDKGKGKTVIYCSIAFSLGLSTVFILLGLVANSIGSIFLIFKNEIRYLSGLLIILFGVHFLGFFRLAIFEREWRWNSNIKTSKRNLAAYVLGLTFAFGWTPCIGPILGSILAIIAQEDSIYEGVLLMFLYSAGLSIPFVISAFLLAKGVLVTSFLSKHFFVIEKTIGIFLIIIGISFLTGSFQSIGFYLLEIFPFLSIFG
jgi:cytochrome c-type biogenesis protein